MKTDKLNLTGKENMGIKMIRQFRGIIWDWNGTLINDTLLAVESMNSMLIRRGLPALSISQYKKVFTFPVKEYYQVIGFDLDKEPFMILTWHRNLVAPASWFPTGINLSNA